ncbi:DUF6456 domain-containing protein [Litorimonas sp. RW-G-Af-16]|uniref:DUF6456 domain-containing protein n=1 Tax=Litorimonas sp. RW-G-Af-16 TaxID=3241168 RepID=UPI00390C8D5E
MLSERDQKFIKRMIAERAVINVTVRADAYQVFPNGDRRRRTGVFWVQHDRLQRLLAEGALDRTPKGYVVRPSLERRLKNTKISTSSVDGQHYDLEERDIFIPGGSIRKANLNRRNSALERLARKRGRDGRLILRACEVEAGRRLAKDYAMAGAGHVSTQNYDTAGVDGGRRADAQENTILSHMTAKTRLLAARAALGDGLENAVIAVCCRDESLDSVERAERWVKSSGLSILKIGLARLVTLYGTEAGSR